MLNIKQIIKTYFQRNSYSPPGSGRWEDYSSWPTRRQKCRTRRRKSPFAVLKDTFLIIRPFPGIISSIKPFGHLPLGVSFSTNRTRSPTSSSSHFLCHIDLLWSSRRYSLIHRFQKDSTQSWTCFHFYIQPADIISAGILLETPLSRSRWFWVSARWSLESLETMERGWLFKILSNSHIVVSG